MNAAAKNIKPPENSPEAFLNSFESADSRHSVYGQYGNATATFYNVPAGVAIDESIAVDGWLAMPLQDSNRSIIGIAYLSPVRSIKPVFDKHLKGCVIFGKPEKDKPLFVVSSPEAAFKISLTGNACLLTFTPNDWVGKNSIEPKDAGNLGYVINEWSAAGYSSIYVPVACDVAATYRLWLKKHNVTVLGTLAAITQYPATPAIKAELDDLISDSITNAKWSELLPLREPQPPAPEYPVDAFPEIARDAIEAIAYHVQAPKGLAGQCVLGTLAYIAQIHVNAPSMHNPQGMPCSLFILTEGASGDRKSACHNLADKVIKEREQIRVSEYSQAITDFYQGLSTCKGKKQIEDFVAENPLPRNPKSIFADATIEPIAGAFIAGDIRNGAWASDEGGQFFSGSTMKSETANSALGALTRVFDQGIFERTRAKSNLEKGGIAVDIRLMVNLLGQREVLSRALTDPILRGQGFLPRFIFAAPQSLAGSRINTPEKLQEKSYSDKRLQQFWTHGGKLLPDPSDPISKLDFQEIESNPRRVLELNEQAQSIWLDFYNQTERPQATGGEYEFIKPFAGRAGELARRIATGFAFFEGKPEIDHIAMQGACELVQYSLNEWLRYADTEAVDSNTITAEKVEKWLIKRCKDKRVDALNLREACQYIPLKALRKKDPFNKAIAPLIDTGRARLEIRDGSPCIAINPVLLT